MTASTIGVLPLPPIVRLPTQITAAPTFVGWTRAILRAVAAPQIQDRGVSASRLADGRCARSYQYLGVRSLKRRAPE